MSLRVTSTLVCTLATLAWVRPSTAQVQTVGVFRNDPQAFPGYTLFTPRENPTTYLIDMDGRLVHEWDNDLIAASAYLLPNGTLRRDEIDPVNPFGGGPGYTGRIEDVDRDGNVSWFYELSTPQALLHHDFETLPNGNILMLAWEKKTDVEALAAGRHPALLSEGELWPEFIFEVEPLPGGGGNVVWEWHVWDHLVQDYDSGRSNFGVVRDHPELVDLNYVWDGRADWLHANGIDYNAEYDQIVISLRSISEIWIIDHGTTTAEAASHSGGRQGRGGDLLYRWGNPEAYDHGTLIDRTLNWQHNPQWIPAGRLGGGNLTVFNNGPGLLGPFSTVDELVLPVDMFGAYTYVPGTPYGPTMPIWTYSSDPQTDFYSEFMAGANRLPNGNTMICEALTGRYFEVLTDGTIVWQYVNPMTGAGAIVQGDPVPGSIPGLANQTFRVQRYARDYPGLPAVLTPGPLLERYILLRNADVTDLNPRTPPLATIFTGTGPSSLDPVRDEYIHGFASGESDADPTVCDRPLVFYQVLRDAPDLRMVANGPCSVEITY